MSAETITIKDCAEQCELGLTKPYSHEHIQKAKQIIKAYKGQLVASTKLSLNSVDAENSGYFYPANENLRRKKRTRIVEAVLEGRKQRAEATINDRKDKAVPSKDGFPNKNKVTNLDAWKKARNTRTVLGGSKAVNR